VDFSWSTSGLFEDFGKWYDVGGDVGFDWRVKLGSGLGFFMETKQMLLLPIWARTQKSHDTLSLVMVPKKLAYKECSFGQEPRGIRNVPYQHRPTNPENCNTEASQANCFGVTCLA
jgi:hypothetical protein